MQESRLFKIVYHLLDKGQATAPELAEKFEVSVRTIYRDIDALSEAGIPVYTETGRNGGIRLMDDFVLDKAVLSEKEKQEILTALQSINITQNTDSSRTLQKLSAIFHLDSENWLEVDFSRWGNKESDNKKFELLKSAVIHRKKVKMHYASSYEIISERIIQPFKLVYKASAWYLKAFCTEKQDWRIFKLTRILDLEILSETFPKQNFPKQIDASEGEYHQIVLRFPKEMAYRIYDEFDETQIQKQENGEFIVSAKMPEDAWLTGFLLSFGTQVEILSPVYLKNILAKQAKLIYEKNKS
ncbi:MAG: YafY family transcriptional regulator [Lachnospiraceae bacterium]|nr:YafY family transcriptional regulator [Lachnospiraceae bacterium]